MAAKKEATREQEAETTTKSAKEPARMTRAVAFGDRTYLPGEEAELEAARAEEQKRTKSKD